jgi:hypothetical protein
MAKYQWKKDGPKPSVDAQVFGETVEKIAGDLISAKPEDIVEVARPKTSPIHPMFEWRNDKAAELYRRAQARHFIGALQIVRVEFSDGPTVSNRAFFSVRTSNRTGYIDHGRILSDRDLKRQVLETARQELENYIRKFGSIMALGNYVQRLQEIIDEMRDSADAVVFDATRRQAHAADRDDVEQSTTTAPV